MAFLEIVDKVEHLLKKKQAFRIIEDEGELFIVQKSVSYKESARSALLFFQASIEYLRYLKASNELELKEQLLEIHTIWFSQLKGKSKSLSDQLCYLLLHKELIQYFGKFTLLQWINLQEQSYFTHNKLLLSAINYRIDIGPFFLVEYKSSVRVYAPIKDIQKKTRYSKRGALLGYDLIYNDKTVLSFNKKEILLKSFQVEKGLIRSNS